ncbi:hypothetical protein, partial [Paludibacterium sp.]|uniref:hypothetical protein n=1 Tax=Paludibacterium sp. TaxID=1917523 RepID=UPI0025D379CC
MNHMGIQRITVEPGHELHHHLHSTMPPAEWMVMLGVICCALAILAIVDFVRHRKSSRPHSAKGKAKSRQQKRRKKQSLQVRGTRAY